MTGFVVDASVAVKWCCDEDGSVEARLLLSASYDLIVPDLLFAETASVFWKRVRRGELTIEHAEIFQSTLAGMLLGVFETATLALAALRLAVETGNSVYDCIYVATAMRTGYPLVTADRRLHAGLVGGPHAGLVLLLGDFRPAARH